MTEILQAIQQMVQALLGVPVVIGSLPPVAGYAVSFAGGAPSEIFMPLTSTVDLPVTFNGKGPDQQALASAMNTVHKALTTSKALPFSDSWQIYAITTTAFPQLIGREQNQNWIYGSSFSVKIFMKG